MKPLLGFYVATLSGCIAGGATAEFLAREPTSALLRAGLVVLVMSLLVFAPVYLRVPGTHFVWNPMICVPLGALAGSLTLLSLSQAINGWHPAKQWIPAAVTGATIWLVAAGTYGWFRSDHESRTVEEGDASPNWRRLFLFSIVAQLTLRSISAIQEWSVPFYSRYYFANHPFRADTSVAILLTTGVFLVIFTPILFHRLGYLAIPAWLVSVIAVSGFLGSIIQRLQ